MSGRKLRRLGFGLVASAGAGLLTLTAMMNAAFAYGAPIDGAVAPATTDVPVQLTSYADTLSNPVADLLSAADPTYVASWGYTPPSWYGSPPLGAFNFNIPGLIDLYNTGAILPYDYGYGLTLGGGPLFSFVAESQGTNSGIASDVGLQTLLGGFESYANSFAGTTCLICDQFSLLGPGGVDLITSKTDIPIGALPAFELTTPLGSIGSSLPELTFPLGSWGDTAASSALAVDPASPVTDTVNTLGASAGSDVSVFLANLGGQIDAALPTAADAAVIALGGALITGQVNAALPIAADAFVSALAAALIADAAQGIIASLPALIP
jgi:hypothetical protein